MPPSNPSSSQTSEDIAEDGLDLGLHGRDKLGNGAVIWGKAIREGNEDDVFMAGTFDLSGTDHASGVRQQNDFEQDFGMDG